MIESNQSILLFFIIIETKFIDKKILFWLAKNHIFLVNLCKSKKIDHSFENSTYYSSEGNCMSAVQEIIEKLKTLTLLEASELVSQIEETFGVDASAPAGGAVMMAAMPGGGGAGEAAKEEEKTTFDVVLESFPADKKVAMLKVVRELTGIGLKEVKEFMDSLPKPVKESVSKDEAESVKAKLEELGAKVKIA